MLPCKKIAVGVLVLVGALNVSHAAIVLSFVYDSVSDTTTVTYSGSWNTSSIGTLNLTNHSSNSASFYNLNGPCGVSGAGITVGSGYPWDTSVGWSSYTGDSFGFLKYNVYGPPDFKTGTGISGSMARGGDLVALGFPSNTVDSGSLSGAGGTVNWTTFVVPEPRSSVAMMVSLVLLAWVRKRGVRNR